jgi:Sigma 54 modulation protein / S30EA ribosomal protein
MQIQVNSDKTVAVTEAMIRFTEEDLNRILSRFENQVTRLEVHLSDVNGDKGGPMDKKCIIEARPAGHHPMTVTAHANTVDEAVRAAGQKMKNALETTFAKAAKH